MEHYALASTMSAHSAIASTPDGVATWKQIEQRRRQLDRNDLFILRRIERCPFGQTLWIKGLCTIRRDPFTLIVDFANGDQEILEANPGETVTDMAYKMVAFLRPYEVKWEQVILPDFD